jgi:hypothetical protein
MGDINDIFQVSRNVLQFMVEKPTVVDDHIKFTSAIPDSVVGFGVLGIGRRSPEWEPDDRAHVVEVFGRELYVARGYADGLDPVVTCQIARGLDVVLGGRWL